MTHAAVKTFKEVKQMDTIELKVNIFGIPRAETCSIVDILPEYVIKTEYNLESKQKGTGEAVLYAVIEGSGEYISAYMYYRKFYKFVPLLIVNTLELPLTGGEDLTKYCKYCSDNMTSFELQHLLISIIDMMNYIGSQLSDVKTITKKVREKKVPTHHASTVGSKPAAPKKKKAVVLNADRVLYEINYSEDSTLKSLRTYNRRAESWAVIGHTRHYKSGKTVWVQPHIKGTGTREAKHYIVK